MDIKQDFHTLWWDEFKTKYPSFTKYKARKLFWVRYKQKSEECSEQVRAKRLRNKLAQDKYIREFKKDIVDLDKQVIDKFWIDKLEIRRLLLDHTYTEILNWEMVNWKLVVRDLFRVVRN